jgi:hypothetical protein
MPTRSFAQVAPDSTGKKIANIAVTEPTAPDTSGNATADTVTYQQLVALADEHGEPLVSLSRLLIDIRDQQARTNELLEVLLMKFG